ncbi:MAG: hypothetical protein RIS76_4522, partial [Verrucomicrobiota bacterium]
MVLDSILPALAAGAAGFGVCFAYGRLKERALRAELAGRERDLREQLRRDGEAAGLTARVAAQEQLGRERVDLTQSFSAQREVLSADERRIAERESLVNRQLERLSQQELELRQRSGQLDATRDGLESER